MRLTLLLAFLFVSVLCFAQGERLKFDSPIISKIVEATTDDVAAVNRVYNPSARPVRARWIREITEIPPGWGLAISDGTQDNSVRIDSADFIIAAFGSAPITPHVISDGSSGNVQVTIKVVDLQNRRNQAMATYRFEQSASLRSSRAVKIYPNPGEDEFKISSDATLARITMTNMLGKVVKTYPGNLASYDVSDLPNGIYLVGMIGIDGRVVKTLRFSKRSVRP